MTDHTDLIQRLREKFADDITERAADTIAVQHACIAALEAELKHARTAQIARGDVFADTDPEAQWIKDMENACPACGGSGHKDDAAQAGVWGQYAPSVGPFKEQAMAARKSGAKWDFDTSHDVSEVMPDGTRRKVGTFRHASDAEEAERAVNGVRSGALVPARDVADAKRRGAERMRDAVIEALQARTRLAREQGEHFARMVNENVLSQVKRLPLPPAPQEGE